MTRFSIASFNVKNLIGPNQEYYKYQLYTPEEYAWKEDWLADQVAVLEADIIGFQEIFDEKALRNVINEADARGLASNETSLPDHSKPYRRKAIFRKLKYTPYGEDAALAFAPNVNDAAPGARRPGVATLSRFGFAEEPHIIQNLSTPIEIPLQELGGGDGGHYTLSRLSRPILLTRIPVGNLVISVFNCHLKSKLGEFIRPDGAEFAPEVDLTRYDPIGRAMGNLRAALRRMAEAWVLRRAILEELDQDRPVMVLGDFNDAEHSVSSEIITGEAPFKNYAWMLRHNARHANDRYTSAENTAIQEAVNRVRLYSAEKQFVRKSLRDMVYTSAFGGVFESIDQIYMSRHFVATQEDGAAPLGEMEYFSVLNDHLTDGSHAEAPYNKLASDHGQIMAQMKLMKKCLTQ